MKGRYKLRVPTVNALTRSSNASKLRATMKATRTQALHVLDPRMVSALTFATPEAIAEQLRQRGIATGDADVNLNRALTALATTRAFTLAQPVSHLLWMSRLAPGLAPVRTLFRQMEDLRAAEVPDTFRARETGLLGIALPAAIGEARAAIQPFTGDVGREALVDLDLTMIEWLFLGRVQRRVERDDALWNAWSDLAAALAEADEHEHWLGLHVS